MTRPGIAGLNTRNAHLGAHRHQLQQQQQQLMQGRYMHERQSSNPAALAELAALQGMRHGSPSLEALFAAQNGLPPGSQRQRMMSEYAQAEFLRDFQAASPEEQEQLRAEAMRRIMETERMEERRRRKAAKIAHMVSMNCICILSSY